MFSFCLVYLCLQSHYARDFLSHATIGGSFKGFATTLVQEVVIEVIAL